MTFWIELSSAVYYEKLNSVKLISFDDYLLFSLEIRRQYDYFRNAHQASCVHVVPFI